MTLNLSVDFRIIAADEYWNNRYNFVIHTGDPESDRHVTIFVTYSDTSYTNYTDSILVTIFMSRERERERERVWRVVQQVHLLYYSPDSLSLSLST